MLYSIRKGGFALATAAMCFASAAQAANHTILIVDGAYFPEITHIEEGDNVIFTNNSEATHNIVSENGEWTSGELAVDGRFVLKVRNLSDLNFSGTGPDGAVMLDLDGVPVVGALSFDPQPELN